MSKQPMSIFMVRRRISTKDWSWAYIASFLLVASMSYQMERHIEPTQAPLLAYNN